MPFKGAPAPPPPRPPTTGILIQSVRKLLSLQGRERHHFPGPQRHTTRRASDHSFLGVWLQDSITGSPGGPPSHAHAVIPEHAALSQESMINPALHPWCLWASLKSKSYRTRKGKFCFLLWVKRKETKKLTQTQTENFWALFRLTCIRKYSWNFCCCICPHGRFSRILAPQASARKAMSPNHWTIRQLP